MMATSRTPWALVSRQALAAGVAGAVTYDLYLWLTVFRHFPAGMPGGWQSTAAAVVGRVAFTSPAFEWVGLAIHAIVSIAWAGGFAYLAARQPALTERWLIAGLLYGIVVYVVMGLILLAGNAFTMPANPTSFINSIVAHTLFFGVPVAFVVKLMEPRAEA